MKNSSRTISGLDIQREYISVAQYSPDENAVELVAIQPVSIIPGADLGDQISDDLRELKSKFKFNSPDIVCSVPSEYAIVKHLQIDADDPTPEESLNWELSQQLINGLDDFVFDFQESMQKSADLKNFLAVAYRNETVHGVFSALKKIKLNPLIMDLDIFALVNIFEVNYREKLEFPSVIIHSENDKTKLILCRDGELCDFEFFNHDSNSLDPINFAEKTRSELDKLLSLNYSLLENNPVGIYYTGSLYTHQQYADNLISKLGNGELLDPFLKIECKVGIGDDQLQAYKSQLAVAVGLAYRGNT